MSRHDGLPVHGYVQQNQSAIDLVNRNKVIEEQMLRIIDELRGVEGIDPRWLAIGVTNLEQAFMAINRAIFRPQRVTLPWAGATPTEEERRSVSSATDGASP